MIKLRLKEKRLHNQSAFFATIIVLVTAFLTARFIGISWSDITQMGAMGSLFYFGMFALFVGVPAYFALYYFAHLKEK